GDSPSMAASLTDQIFGLPSQPSRVMPLNSLTIVPGVAGALGAASGSAAGAASAGGGIDGALPLPAGPPPPPGSPAAPPVPDPPPLPAAGGVGDDPGAPPAPHPARKTHASSDERTNDIDYLRRWWRYSPAGGRPSNARREHPGDPAGRLVRAVSRLNVLFTPPGGGGRV